MGLELLTLEEEIWANYWCFSFPLIYIYILSNHRAECKKNNNNKRTSEVTAETKKVKKKEFLHVNAGILRYS